MSNDVGQNTPKGVEGPRATASEPARSIPRRVLRFLGWSIFAALAAVAALAVAIDFGWQRERILAFADSLAEGRLGVEIEVSRASGRLWRGIELENVVLGDPADPLVEIDSLQVRWNALSLLSRELWIAESIQIEGWTVHLHRTREGRWRVLDDVLEHLAERGEVDVAVDLPSPSLLVRRIGLGPGSLFVVVERRPGDPADASEVDAPARPESPLRAEWQGRGTLRRLEVGPGAPLEVGAAGFEATLVEIESALPDFDRAASARLTLSIVEQRLESLELDIESLDLRASARAAGSFARLDRLELDVEVPNMAPLAGWMQARRPVTGRLSARADLAGPTSALAGTLRIDAADLVVDSVRAAVFDLTLEGVFDPMNFDPDAFDARFDLRTRGFDAGSFAEGLVPAGQADADLEGQVEGGEIIVRRGNLALAGLSLHGTGRVSRERVDGLDVRFEMAEVAPWVAVHRPDLPLAGQLAGEARLSGSLEALRGNVALRSRDLKLRGKALGQLEMTLTRESDRAAEFVVALESGQVSTLRGRATIDPERERVDFEATTRLGAWLALLDEPPSVDAEIDGKGFVERTPGIPRFSIDLRSRETVVEGHPLGRVDLVAATRDAERLVVSKLEIAGERGVLSLPAPATIRTNPSGTWSFEETAIDISVADHEPGRIRLRGEGMKDELSRLDASIEAFPVALVNAFDATLPPLAGGLSGDVGWARERRGDWLHGELEWLEPGLAALRLDRLSARWQSTPAKIDVALETDVGGRSPIAVEGEILLPHPRAMLAEIFSPEQIAFDAVLDEWDLAALEPLTPRAIRGVAGSVSGEIRVEPRPDGPHLSGQATVTGGGFSVPILRQRFEPIEASLSLDGRRILVDSLRVGDQGADARLVGAVALLEGGESKLDGAIRFDHLPLSRSSAAWFDVLGDVQLSGRLAGPVVRGDVSIEDTRIGVPEEDDPIMKEIRIASRGSAGGIRETETPERTFRDGADLDVTIRMPSSTRIRGQGANLWIEGEVRILKPALEPHRVLGEARVVNGTYRFQGRRFQVRRGSVRFTGDERLDPILDIEARLPVSDIMAIIDITGRLSAPIVRLQSEPPMDERDVLAYLVFGRRADEIGATNDSAFDAAAARLAAGVAETELHDLLGDAMPIDTIEVEADETGRTSALGVGKYLGPDLFLRYVHTLGDEPTERVGVEYRLNNTFSIGSSVSSTGDAGLDLILRHDF